MVVVYKNLHPYPLFLPRAGSQVAFVTGGWSPDPWWSRHVGKDGLSRVEVTDKQAQPPPRTPSQPMMPTSHLAPRVAPRIANPPRPVAAPLPKTVPYKPPPPRVPQAIEEETDTYIRQRGIYKCKCCDLLHRTGQLALHLAHVARVHPNHVSVVPKEPTATAPTPVDVPPPVPDIGAIKMTPETLPEGLPYCKLCAQQGAAKRFKNNTGLAGHLHHKHSLTLEQHDALPEVTLPK